MVQYREKEHSALPDSFLQPPGKKQENDSTKTNSQLPAQENENDSTKTNSQLPVPGNENDSTKTTSQLPSKKTNKRNLDPAFLENLGLDSKENVEISTVTNEKMKKMEEEYMDKVKHGENEKKDQNFINFLKKVRDNVRVTSTDEKSSGKKLTNKKFKGKINKKIKETKEKIKKGKERGIFSKIFYNKNKEENGAKSTFFQQIKLDLSSTRSSIFIYYCLVSVIVFTITLFLSYNNKKINEENKKIINETKDYYISGMSILGLVLFSMCFSFGEDKDILQKLASLILLGGGLFLGGVFIYLFSGDDFKNLTPSEILISCMAIVTYIAFILSYIAFILFEEVNGEIGEYIRLMYSIVLFISFIIIGFSVVRFNQELKIPKGERESFLVPLCTGLYAGGLAMLFFGIMSAFPAINNAITAALDIVTGLIELWEIKLLIIGSLIMCGYYSFVFYKAHSTFNSKEKHKHKGTIELIKTSYEYGFILSISFLISMALGFGGSMKEKFIAAFLTFFVVFVGGYLTYLNAEGKIEADSELISATIGIFLTLLAVCVIYTAFHKRDGNESFFEDLLRIVSSIGSIGMFGYMFVVNILAVDKKLFGDEKNLLLTGLGISSGIIVLFFLSFFLL